MNRLNKLAAAALAGMLVLPATLLLAKTHKGDKLRNDARNEELKGNFDHALELAEQAMAQDPGDPSYVLAVRRIRFETGTIYVRNGQQLRKAGKLDEALAEFEKAMGIDPASDIAIQEVRRTREMIEREKNGGQPTGASLSPEERKTLTPAEVARRDTQERTESLLPVPELRPLNNDLIDLKMSNRPRVLFETVAKVAGVNVLFDPDYNQSQTITNVQVDLGRTTLEQALDQLAVVTKSFWKPLSPNTIFVTVDNQQKRREYAEQVVKVFYLSNVTGPQEMQEILTVIRTVVDVQKVFNYTAQNAIVVRAEADTMALVEKLIADLDKPRPEVVVDVMVMQVSSSYMRNITAAFAATGINVTAASTPRSSLSSTATTTSSGSGRDATTGTTTTGTTTTTTSIPINNLGHLSTADWSLTSLPGAQFEAVLNESSTRVLQAPQIRAADSSKASIKIGDKVPTATGSYNAGATGVGISPLVNTQFTFLDVGVNVEITPHIHNNNEVSLHVDLDVSQVKDRIDLGGVLEPEISQNKSTVDVRLRDGEVNLIGGIIQQTNSRGITGIPGLASIPVLGKLFSGENVERDRTELVIALIPHIVRSPQIDAINLRPVASGNSTQIKVNYAPRKTPPPADQPQGLVTTPSSAAPPATAPPATAPAFPPPPVTAPPAPAGPPSPGGPARVSFLPDNVDTQLSSALTVTVYGENISDMTAVTSHIQFDPRILRINNIVAGDLPQKNGAALQPAKNILNDSGMADVNVSRGPNDGGVSGSGGLFSIVFQAVGRGNTQVSLTGIGLTASTGQPIQSNVPPALTVNVR